MVDVVTEQGVKELEERLQKLEGHVRNLRHIIDLIEAVLRNAKD